MRKRKLACPQHIATWLLFILLLTPVFGQDQICPWAKDEQVSQLLSPHCLCVQNPSNAISIQCEQVDGHYLIAKLSKFMQPASPPLELLYLNASRVTDADGVIPPKFFSRIKLVIIIMIILQLQKSFMQSLFSFNYIISVSLSHRQVYSCHTVILAQYTMTPSWVKRVHYSI